jgi:Flp pilus assembly protein TadD
LPAVTIDQRVQVRQAEAALLRDANDNSAAYAVLTQALIEHPDTPDLLYDAAMVAEKLDKIDEAEARLRRVVELKPDDAQALNALGYTLVDRTPRTSEGFALIEKAHKLAPEDPYILDSMGWAFYRLGNLDDAEAYLRRAMTQRPDAEIAAHLGEVLWKKGDLVRAKEVWQSQLQATPANEVLLETVRRYSK